jgi:hypothetical protein
MKFVVQFTSTEALERQAKTKEKAAELRDSPVFQKAESVVKPYIDQLKALDTAHKTAAKSTKALIPAILAFAKDIQKSEELSVEASLRVTRHYFKCALVRGGVSENTASKWLGALEVNGDPLFAGRSTAGKVKPFKDSAAATAAVMKALESAAKKGASLSDVLAAAVALNLPIGDKGAIAALLNGKI